MRVKDMVLVSLFTAIIAVFGFIGYISLPGTPVPITLQTLGVMLAGSILGAKRGSLALILFIILVAIGLPVLAGFRGGVAQLIGPTAGYIWSWPIAAFVIGYLVERFYPSLSFIRLLLIHLFGGVLVIYAIGVPFLAVFYDFALYESALSTINYIPGDLLKAILASTVALSVNRVNPLIESKHQQNV